MTEILFLTSSPRGGASYSNRVAARVLEELRRAHPESRVTVRDLAKNPVPHIDEDFVTGIFVPADRRNAEQRERLAVSDLLIDELLAADVVVIAVGMINFGIPSTLKAWIDHVTRAGRTFQYGESGPRGLVTGKRVILVEAKGGIYSDGPRRELDHVTPYLLQLLAFLGMTDLKVIGIEGAALEPEAAEKALETALKQAIDLVRELIPDPGVPLARQAQHEGELHALVSF
jgi:FMN-dependent NADH-azoreductase